MNIIKDSIYHILFVGLLSAYSVQVCPHASGMGFVILTMNFLIIAAVFFGIRRFVCYASKRSGRFHIVYDLSHFFLIGLLVGFYNYLFREFPIESAYKIVVGALILGFFTTVIAALERPFHPEKKKTSFITTISIFFFVLISLLSIIWILLVVEDVRVFDELLNGSMGKFPTRHCD